MHEAVYRSVVIYYYQDQQFRFCNLCKLKLNYKIKMRPHILESTKSLRSYNTLSVFTYIYTFYFKNSRTSIIFYVAGDIINTWNRQKEYPESKQQFESPKWWSRVEIKLTTLSSVRSDEITTYITTPFMHSSGISTKISYMNPPECNKVMLILVVKYFLFIVSTTRVRCARLLWDHYMSNFQLISFLEKKN